MTRGLAIEGPDESRQDEPIPVRVTGASPGATVEFEAEVVDGEGDEWRSWATFVADGAGVVDLSEHAPESGSYEGVAPMGWCWSMTTDADRLFAALGDDVTVELRATTGGRRVERTITRRARAGGVTRHPVEDDDLVGVVYDPPGDGPHPGVLLLHGSGGHVPVRLANLLATDGYATLALKYFGSRDPLPGKLERIPLSYFETAADWLRARPAVTGDRVGAVGVSRGAELSMLLGARFDWVGAVVSYAGSGVAWDTPHDEPAWIHDGDPVAHLVGRDTPHGTVDAGLDDEPLEAATIAVENVDGPVLLLSGAEDRIWPARRLSSIAADRLRDRPFEHAFEHRTYDGVGHWIPVPYVPTTGDDVGGGTARARARAAVDSWPAVLKHLARGLDPGRPGSVREDHDRSGVTADHPRPGAEGIPDPPAYERRPAPADDGSPAHPATRENSSRDP